MAKKKKVGFKIPKDLRDLPDVKTGRVQPRKPVQKPGAKSGSFGDASLNPSQGGLNLRHRSR